MRQNRIVRSTANAARGIFLFGSVLLWSAGCSTLRNAGCDEILSVGKDGMEQSQSHLNKGIHLFDKGKLQAAEEEFQRAISFQHENGTAHNNLGLIYFQQRKLADAAKEFEIAAQFLNEDPTPWNNLGMTLEAAGRGVEAIEYYQHAYELSPNKPMYLGNLVRTRIRLGENDESVIAQLKELLFIETRPEWVAWISDQLALDMNPMLDRGPVQPDQLTKNKSNAMSKKNGQAKPAPRNETDLAPIVNSNGEPIFLTPSSQYSDGDSERVLAVPNAPR